MEDLKEKKIVITGATDGIGKCLVTELLARNAHVAFCGKSAEKMKQVISGFGHGKVRPKYFESFDITQYDHIVKFMNAAEKELGGIDALVNCAGVNSARSAVESIKIEDLEWMLKVNMIAPMVFMQEAFRRMKPNKKGLIINVLSTVCMFSNEGIGSYTASKTGFDGLTKVFRKEARREGIRVCGVYPGGVNTAFRPNAREDFLSPKNVAEVIISILSADPLTALDDVVLRPFIETNYC